MGKVFLPLAATLFFFLPCFAQAEDCDDCEAAGWGEMDITCPDPIKTKNDFKQCLLDLPEAGVTSATGIDEFREGYIRLHEPDVLESPDSDSIKVFYYQHWAVDKQGHIYLLNQSE